MNDNPHRVDQGAAGAEAVDQFQQQQHTAPPPTFQSYSPIADQQGAITMRDHALNYALLGWKIFRLSRSKKPMKGSHGFKDATTDPAIIDAWFRETPQANLGFATGEIVVIDADGEGGIAKLKAMADQHGGLPPTLTARTPRGGLHLHYRCPPGVEVLSSNDLRAKTGDDGLDIKGRNAYVLLPPSRTDTGRYEWINDEDISELPTWLVEYAASRRGQAGKADPIFAGKETRPAYLLNSTNEITAREIKGLDTSWSAHEEARLRSALKFIPADAYDTWIRVGMALHKLEWNRSNGTSIACDLWDEWSATCSEKYSQSGCEAKWSSFGRGSYNGEPITVRSIFRWATKLGWPANNPPNANIQNQTIGGANATTTNGCEHKKSAPSDDDIEISRLAKLSLIDYDRERKAVAERLNIRAPILDRLVAAERDKFDDGGKQGHTLNLSEPEPWSDPVNGADLLDALSANVRQHVVMSDHAADTAALWAVHTHLLDCFGISPRLAITSPEKGCGKTTALDVVSRLVSRPLPTANASAAAIFRIVELQRPTLLIDEADTFLPENEELRGILNSGHRHGGSVIRTVGEEFEPRSFSTYSACAIALIGKLPPTLADRSVPIELRRRKSDEPIKSFRFDRTEHLDHLARKAVRWAKDNADHIRGADPDMPAGVFNRAADNWRPLLAIADAAGGAWPVRARHAVQSTVSAATGNEQSVRVLLLSEIRAIFAERNLDRLSSADLVGALNAIEGRPWAEWNRGKGLSPNGLARLLAPFAITPATIRTPTGTPKGYQRAQFEDAFARYLPRDEI